MSSHLPRFLLVLSLLSWASAALAHPVPRSSHDRTVRVQLTATAVLVEYRVELDEWTLAHDVPQLPGVQVSQLSKPSEYRAAFYQHAGPWVADGLKVTIDGQAVPLRFIEAQPEPLVDSVPCVFRLRGEWALPVDSAAKVRIFDTNYDDADERGKLELTLTVADGLTESARTAPSAETIARPYLERQPGDEAKLRTLLVTLRKPAIAVAAPPTPPVVVAPPPPEPTIAQAAQRGLPALLDLSYGLPVLLLLAFGFGMAHALTPGHGKTMVAAYLVGERGTAWHALVLGLTTTITHTGTVLLVAALLSWVYPNAVPANVQTALGVAGGVLVTGLGLQLFFKRLAGQPDHIHLPGSEHAPHHHHHGDDCCGHDHGHAHSHAHAHHHHHEPGAACDHDHVHGAACDHAHEAAPGTVGLPVVTHTHTHTHHDHGHHHHDHGHHHHHHDHPAPAGWWGVIVLGVSGGLVPCWDAIALLLITLASGQAWLGVPLLLAFSAGLAAVLVALGLIVVAARKASGERFGQTKWFRALPVLSAAALVVIGLWLCRESLRIGG